MKFFNRIIGNKSSSGQTRNAAPAQQAEPGISSKLALGAGCYWGTEKYVRKDFQKKFPGSIKSATVGFMSPSDDVRIKNPTYQQVCTGTSGHVEVLVVELNDPERHFEELIRFFFQFHDPTTKNRQGNDVGFQYASFIFCADRRQSKIVEKVRAELQSVLDSGALKVYANNKITTKVGPLKEFTPAHDEHQRYLEQHPNGYCNHRMRFKMWPELVVDNEEQGAENPAAAEAVAK